MQNYSEGVRNRMANLKRTTKTTVTESHPSQNGQAERLREAAELLQAEKDSRKQQFLIELQALCQKHRCDLIPMFQVDAK